MKQFEKWFEETYPLPSTTERGPIGRDMKCACKAAYQEALKWVLSCDTGPEADELIEQELNDDVVQGQDMWCEECKAKIEIAKDMDVISICKSCAKRNLQMNEVSVFEAVVVSICMTYIVWWIFKLCRRLKG